ncbi:hypothetical protein ACF08W_35020 [Streptomyces sp. NPDC015144]|uniref:hypothetical protein n=1 Tax=Streptomyces sp. NPDC015144 TaxID=3364944 RepID=UPI0036FD93FD
MPVGGGGLAAGTATIAKHLNPGIQVIGAEPEEGADTLLSMRCGRCRASPRRRGWTAAPRARCPPPTFAYRRTYGDTTRSSSSVGERSSIVRAHISPARTPVSETTAPTASARSAAPWLPDVMPRRRERGTAHCPSVRRRSRWRQM